MSARVCWWLSTAVPCLASPRQAQPALNTLCRAERGGTGMGSERRGTRHSQQLFISNFLNREVGNTSRLTP